MARMRFGGSPADIYMYEDEEGDLRAGGGYAALFYDGPALDAAQVTDLVDANGQPATFITTSDGTDGWARGQLPIFYGPDGRYELWVSINNSPRQLLTFTDLEEQFGEVLEGAAQHIAPGNTNPHNTGFGSLVDVDAAAWDAAAPGSTVIKNVDGTLGVGNAPTPMTDVVWVAASNAPGQFAAAPYKCTGTADNVVIQQAIDNALGLRVGLSPGTFTLAAPIQLSGGGNGTSRYLSGCGRSSTVLTVGSGVSAGIQIANQAAAHVSDMRIDVAGSSHGINAAGANQAGGWSMAAGSVRNVAINGPGNGTHSGWGLRLVGATASVFDNIDINGTGNGVLVLSESASYQTGGLSFLRCSVQVAAANAVGFRVDATSGVTRNVAFVGCQAVGDAAFAGTIGWRIAGDASSVRSIGCTALNFLTALSVTSNVTDVVADFSEVTLRTGGTFAAVAGYGNHVRAGYLFIPASATVTLINETNASAQVSNVYEMVTHASTGSTASGTLTTGVIRSNAVNGTGTVPAIMRQNPHSTRRTLTWHLAGSLAGRTGAGIFRWYNELEVTVYIRSVRATVGTAPTGAAVLVDVNLSGATIFITQANRPTIAAGATSSGKVTNMNQTGVVPGAYLSVDLDQVGSTVAGSDLTVQVEVS